MIIIILEFVNWLLYLRHTLKKILPILLILLIFFQSFEKMSILVYYQTYKDHIAKYLCENRNNPESNCNGQCFLMKKLRKAEEGKSTPVVPDNQKSEYLLELFDNQDELHGDLIHKVWPSERQWIEKEYLSRIFRPPKG